MIPQEFIDQVLERVDIVDLIHARVPLRKAGRDFVACCPFHNEKTPSFHVSPTKQFYHCFGCGAHGNSIGFLIEYNHLSFPEAVEDLARIAGMIVPQTRPDHVTPKALQKSSLLDVLDLASVFYAKQLRNHPQRETAVHYLKQRGISGEIANAYSLGFAPQAESLLCTALQAEGVTLTQLQATGLAQDHKEYARDRFWSRVMFPIRNRQGRTIGFGGRIMDKGEPKYLNSPETEVFHKGRELYGLYEVCQRLRHIPRLLVVEGYMDVIALAQYGIEYAVATLGTATTADHVERLFRVCGSIVFCFDGDRAGREAAWRALTQALPLLTQGRQIHFLLLPDGEDPDSLVRKEGKETFEQRLMQAQTLSDYLQSSLVEQVNLSTLDGRAQLLETAQELLGKMPDTALRELLAARLSDLTGNAQTLQRFQVKTALPNMPADFPPYQQPWRERTNPAFQRSRYGDHRFGGPRAHAGGAPTVQRNPMRYAICLLLQDPTLVQKLRGEHRAIPPDLPGANLLLAIIDLLQDQPQIHHVGQLLEHFRGSNHEIMLQKLLGIVATLPEEADYETEFFAILKHLSAEETPRQQALKKMMRGDMLSAEEQQLLR